MGLEASTNDNPTAVDGQQSDRMRRVNGLSNLKQIRTGPDDVAPSLSASFLSLGVTPQ